MEDQTASDHIPFNRPSLEGAELDHLADAVAAGHTAAKGPSSARVAAVLSEAEGAAEALLTTSCTAALELAAMLVDLRPGDTVIVPSYTFVSTALAFAREGADLVFADIEPTTLGIDPHHVAELLDDAVRAVVPVPYGGVNHDIEGLAAVLEGRPDVSIIVDNAHGLFGRFQGRSFGADGRFSTLSFHETKNFHCGEGGALLLNDPADVERAHVLYDKGTNRRAYFEGLVDKYTWVDRGSSFGLSDLLAGYLMGQLEQRDRVLARRGAVIGRYRSALEPVATRYGLQLPHVPEGCEPSHHMFFVLLPDPGRRRDLLALLQGQGVGATFHYQPLHRAEGAKAHLGRSTECPVTDDVSARLLRLPLSGALRDDEVDRVIEAVLGGLERLA